VFRPLSKKALRAWRIGNVQYCPDGFSSTTLQATLPAPPTWTVEQMRDILAFAVLLLAVCALAMTTSALLPSPDGAIFAAAILLSASVLALMISVELGEGRINRVGDIMHAIDQRRVWRLTCPAYLLGWSLVASITVLTYRGLT